MPEHVRSKNKVMECLLERAVRSMGFVLTRDGSHEPTDVKWLEKPTFFTRTYRLQVDGEWVNTWVRFIYDTRTGYADLRISYKDLEELDKVASAAEAHNLSFARALEQGVDPPDQKESWGNPVLRVGSGIGQMVTSIFAKRRT